MRVALDTNVLVSSVATRGLCADILQATLAEHELVVGEAVLGELRRVLQTKLRIPAHTINELDAFLRAQAIIVSEAPAIKVKISDPADLLVLAQALAGGASVLVTGDKHLLEISGKVDIPIVTPRGFWDLLRNPNSGSAE
jgi:putative PIN family toxin of toxin-antitoxin system